ncbi:hypothetical protein OSB04_020087 [Centaurea solstitialis]|uniref:Integrase catalytic domain-containing protein n=1 Tax=Centaurea solstitialis TaxID=347529 RepID=A0AA38SRJ9_9ASTR|nr:hypothetical protein OSB04_020087 [Centaurea solstitialis]
MNQVSYVDGLKHNPISVSQLCDNGLDVMFKIKFCVMYKVDTLIEVMRAKRKGDLYLICFDIVEAKNKICLVSSVKNEEAWLWHTRFCHFYFHTLDKLVRLKLVKGLPNIKFEKDHLCSACKMGKLRRSFHKTKSDPSYDKPLQLLHVDRCGPTYVQSLGEKKYILNLLKKSQVPLIRINLLKRLQVLHDLQGRVLRSDNGTTFKNYVIEEYLGSVGITHNFSAPRTPQQNGLVERKNRTIVEVARTMLNASRLPITFWAVNKSLVVKRFDKTPYQLLHSKRPNIKFFHVFDSVAYRVYIPKTQIVVVSTNVRFDDNFQVTRDKFIEELKIQAEKSPNAIIKQDLENLFNEWYKDEDDPNKTSADIHRASAEPHPVADASPISTNISGPSTSDTPSSSILPPEVASSNGTSNHSTTQEPTINEPIPIPSQATDAEPESTHTSDPASQTLILQEINSTINLPHAIKWTKDHPQSQNHW